MTVTRPFRKMWPAPATGLLLALLLTAPTTSSAADRRFDCPGLAGSLTTASCWTANTLPTAADNAFIGHSAINFDATGNLASGTFQVDLEYVGYSRNGTVNQTGGTHIVDKNLYMGYDAGITGTFNLSGGTLTTNNDGGTYFQTVGYSGTGNFVHTDGTFDSGPLYVAYLAGSVGDYSLSGTSILTVKQSMRVGDGGAGVFTQTGGSTTISQPGSLSSLDLGRLSTGNGTYNLSGGTLAAGGLFVGSSGTGTVNHSGGTATLAGSLYNGTLYIGGNAGSNGSYDLSGTGGLNVNNLVVGQSGAGVFTQTGGTNSVAGTLSIAAFGSATGTYDLQGGSLTAALLINNDTVNYSGGSLNAAIDNTADLNVYGAGTRSFSGAVTNNGTIDVATNTTAAFNAFVTGAGDFTGGGTSEFNGGFSPGNSPAQVDVAGDVVFGSGNTLLMELAGLTPGTQYDVLDIQGDAYLDGILDIDFLGGFNPVAGDTFDLLFAEVLHGSFGSSVLPGLNAGLVWDLQYLLNPTGTDTVRLSVQAQVVPVPAAAWLFGSALLLVGALRRR
jgi:hypothetical protein